MSSDGGLGIIIAGAVASSGGAGKSSKPLRSIGPIIAQVTIEEKHQDDLEITDHPVEQGATISDHAFKRPATVTLRVAWSNSSSTPAGLTGGIAGALQNKLAQQVQDTLNNAAAKAIGGSALGNLGAAEISNRLGNFAAFTANLNTGKGKGTSTVVDVYQQLLKLQTDAVPFDVYTGKRKYSSMLIQSMTVETDKTTENSLMAILICRQVIIVQTQIVSVTAAPEKQAAPEKTNAPADEGTKNATPVEPKSNPDLQRALLQAQSRS